MKHKWFTECINCDVVFVIQSDRPIGDPDEAEEWMDCCYCGSSLRGWSEE